MKVYSILMNRFTRAVSDYYGVSPDAAKYICFRREKGLYRHKSDPSYYMRWSVQLLNALIIADSTDGWDWGEVNVKTDIRDLRRAGIDVRYCSFAYPDEQKSEPDGWTVVNRVKTEKTLRSAGLLFRVKRARRAE